MNTATDIAEPLQLDVSGMTCAACAGRVERALNKICLLYTSRCV